MNPAFANWTLRGRDQDELDLRMLARTVGDRVDWNYCVKVATELGEAIDQDLVSRVIALRDGADSD
jgi:hypothetical protein